MKTNIFKVAGFIGVVSLLATSCTRKSQPPLVYFPDMYFPVSYWPLMKDQSFYSDHVNELPPFAENGGQTALTTVDGTVPQNADGILPDPTPKNQDEYNQFYNDSKNITTSPLNPKNAGKDIARGKILFDATCAACHGVHGDGQGPIVESGAYSGVPNYKDRDITIGTIHFVLENGRNNMGSYAAQFTPGDRWRVAMYVMHEFKDVPAQNDAMKAAAAAKDKPTENAAPTKN